MSSQLNSGIIASGVAMWSALQVWDEGRDDLYQPRFNWNYQQRSKEMAGGGKGNWVELWPLPKMCSGDPAASLCMFGQDASEAGRFEAPSSISRGAVRPWFIRGTCKDSGGNPLGGAVVQCFRTADDLFVGEVACDDRGQYEVRTPYYGVGHYLVALYASGNLAGSTINTLQPTL